MINDIISEFHRYRRSGNQFMAWETVLHLKRRFAFSKQDIITALITEEFLERECMAFIEEFESDELCEISV